jgi:hypothetical protein
MLYFIGGYIVVNKEIKPFRIMTVEAATFFVSVAAFFVLNRLYNITYKAFWAGVFGRANDSVWEQTKIVFLSFFVLSFLEFFIFRSSFIRFFVAKTASMLFITLALPGFLYGYSGAIGLDINVIDITGAVTILFFAFVISCKIILNKTNDKRFAMSFICFALLLSCFLTLTVYAPSLPFFKDPKTGAVGLDSHYIYVSNNTFFT